jgi:hypothetical protein
MVILDLWQQAQPVFREVQRVQIQVAVAEEETKYLVQVEQVHQV